MNKIFLSIVLMIGALTMAVGDADAQRMGKRASFGRQSNNVTQKAAPANTANAPARPGAATAAPGAIPPKPRLPWKGIVGGLIGGALLAGLFSSMGMGGAMSGALGSIMTFALIGFALFFLFRFFTRRKDGADAPSMFKPQGTGNSSSIFNPQPAYAGMPNNAIPEIGSRIDNNQTYAYQTAPTNTLNNASFGNSTSGTAQADQGTWTLPADFDVTGFLRHAKSNFIRLQAAWDRGDINDIREFTSPQMFAEMKLELQDRGTEKNETDVVTLDAELLGIETQSYDYLASVQFSGMIKEGGEATAQPFKEVWNLAKPIDGKTGWILAGIQQLA